MDDYSNYCTCSPIFKLPTREDLLHPQSRITHEELIEYRTMQGFIGHKKTEYSELEKDKNQDFKCAEAGLAHYNKIHSANYKLVEATNSHGFFCGWVWYHCVFKAAPETSSEPELFFAELHALGLNTYHVITVASVKPEFYQCSYCPDKKMPHPASTLSQDPQLLYSEGMIDIGLPSEKLHYQQAVESLKKISLDYCPKAYHNQQKLSLSKEELEQIPEIKTICTGGFGFNGASDLKPIFRNSNNEVGLFFYNDEQNEEIEEEEEEEEKEKVDLKSLTWEDVLYNHLRIRRKKKKKNNGPGTPPSVGGKQVGQEHEKGPDLPLLDVDVDAAPKESGHVKRMIQSMEDNITKNTN